MERRTLKSVKESVVSWLVFFCTVSSLSIWYAALTSGLTTGDLKNGWDPLSSASWNRVVNSVIELDSRTAGGKLSSIQSFTTAGVSTWTRPAGVTRIKVYVTGGGGGGWSHNSDDAQGGGWAGGTAIKIMDVSAIPSVTVTVGAGGVGSCGNLSNGGTAGGNSSFWTYATGNGGTPPSNWAIWWDGGTATWGNLNLTGNDGGGGNIDGGGNEETGWTGWSSYWGGGGRGGSYWAARKNGTQGSGGGGTHAVTNDCGGNGGAWMVVVEEFS